MKKICFILAVMVLALTLPVMAQNVEAGVKAYESGDYKGAMAELDKALATQGQLKEKAAARAHYYRALSRMTYVHKAKSNLEGTQMKQIRELSVGAHEDLLAAKKNDVDGKMTTELQAANKRLVELFVELGRDANAVAQDQNKNATEKKEAHEDLKRYGEPITVIDKFNYLGYLFRAAGEVGLGDSVAALRDYHLTDDWFFRSAPKDGDMFIAYTYIQIARLEWALNKNYDVAMKAIEEGRTNLGNESKKFESMGNRPPAEKAALSRLRHDIGLDLDRAASDLRLAAGK